jgi:hypothetical protein
VPDLELTPDSWVERGAEVVGWWLARLEHWLSASGWLRAWLRLEPVPLHRAHQRRSAPAAPRGAGPRTARPVQPLARLIFGEVFKLVTGLPPVVISLGVLYLGYVVYRHFRRKRTASTGRIPTTTNTTSEVLKPQHLNPELITLT